jgi:hemolysin type calcium-binding protein
MGSTDRFSSSSAHLWRILAIALAATLAAAAFGAASASASTVSKSGSTLTYAAANNETNQTIVSLSGGTYTFSDNGATVGVGSGCTSSGAHSATCAGAGVTAISVVSGNMNDLAWETASTAATLIGGDGNDNLIGGGGADVLIGCGGDDTYNGGGGADTFVDGAFCSGGGADTVTYAGRSTPVFVSLDGQANDGQAGEGDSVAGDIENVIGGNSDDTIAGGRGDNHIQGGAGNDSIVGEQDPTFDPTVGNDNLEGGDGNDSLNGGDGDNQLDGGNGNDVIQGGFGSDRFIGGAGNDTLQADDGVFDQLSCGSGTDSGTADPDDLINPDCEAISLQSFDDGGDFGGDFGDDSGDFIDSGATGPCSLIRIAQHPVTMRRGSVGIRLSLPLSRGSACRGTLKLVDLTPSSRPKQSGQITKLGSSSFSVRGDKSKRVRVQISPQGRRQIVHAGHLTALAKVVPRGKKASKAASALITIKTS